MTMMVIPTPMHQPVTTSALGGYDGTHAAAKESRLDSRLAKFRQIYRITRDHRDVYRGATDVLKSFLLRYSTTHKQIANALFWLKHMSLRVDGVPGRVYVRPPGSDFLVLREIFELGEYFPARKWNLPADARIFDLGANIGLATLFLMTLAPEAHFLVVEPDEGNCQLIERNCRRLVEQNRLQIIQGFAAAKDGVAGLDRRWRRSWAYHKVDTVDAEHEAVRCYDVEHLLDISGFDQLDVLKCDVEGSEQEIFKNCQRWVHRVNHMIVETHHPGYSPQELYRQLRDAGWHFEVTDERAGDNHSLSFLKRR
jgi:FkbM family methyltransferase